MNKFSAVPLILLAMLFMFALGCEPDDPPVIVLITVQAIPEAGGTVSGGGQYNSGEDVMVIAAENSGFVFKDWYEDAIEISKHATYSFTAAADRTLTAHFEEIAEEEDQPTKVVTFENISEVLETNITGITPHALRLNDGRIRLYYSAEGNICSAVSTDGANFTKEGILLAPDGYGREMMIADPSVILTPSGGYRMYYKGAEGSGNPFTAMHRTFSALSQDGLTFVKESLIFDEAIITSVPEALVMPDGCVNLYFVRFDPEDRSVNNQVGLATSSDGLNFTLYEKAVLPRGFVDPAMLHFAEDLFIMISYYIVDFDPNRPVNYDKGIYAFQSPDGKKFKEPEFILSGGMDPCIIKIKGNTYRIYFWSEESPMYIMYFDVTISEQTQAS